MTIVPQAGAIAVRRHGDRVEFLVVSARKNPAHWVFPKGHIEPGETESAAAVRELREETGVVGEIVAPVGTSSFVSGNEDVNVRYFLVRSSREKQDSSSETREGEGRKIRWLPLADARALLTFDDSRRLLDLANAEIERLSR